MVDTRPRHTDRARPADARAAADAGPAATDLLDLARRVMERARPGEQVEAYVSRSSRTEVKVFEGEVESLSSADSAGIGVRVVTDGRTGFAWAGSVDDDAVDGVLHEARDNATFGTPDPFLGLPAPDAVAHADLDLYRPALGRLAADGKVALALEVDRATRAADSRVRGVESSAYGDAVVDSAIASTEGVAASARRAWCSVWSVALAGDGADTQTGYGFSVARDPGELDLAKAAADAADRATRLLGARRPQSRRLTVVLEPQVTASLLGVVSSALSGDQVVKGRSLFAGREGEQVAAPVLTLADDPTDARSFGATPLDAEGLATRRNLLIDGGVLAGFLHNAYTARRMGRDSNACAVRGGFATVPGTGSRALALVPGRHRQDEMLAEIGDGLLVQSITGLHSGVNPVSGDFSVGAEGLMVRGGQRAEPVREATIASTLQRMLHEVMAVGGDVEWLPGGTAGVSVAIGEVTLSGS